MSIRPHSLYNTFLYITILKNRNLSPYPPRESVPGNRTSATNRTSRFPARFLHCAISTSDTNEMKEPAFLMVLTGIGKYAYKRKDRMYAVPADCLKDERNEKKKPSEEPR